MNTAFSGLKAARDLVGIDRIAARITHLDIGFDPNHATLPRELLKDLQRNLRDKDTYNDATDRTEQITIAGTSFPNSGPSN